MPETLNNFNWIDVVFVILLLGMLYKGAKVGVGGQVLSLAGGLFLVFAAVGYYAFLSEAIFGFMLQKWAKPLSFFIIGALIFIMTKLLERVFSIIAGEEVAVIERIGGVIVAGIRAVVLFGLLGMLFLLVPIDSVNAAASEGSETCMFFVNADAQIYSWMSGIAGGSGKKTKDEIVREFLISTRKTK